MSSRPAAGLLGSVWSDPSIVASAGAATSAGRPCRAASMIDPRVFAVSVVPEGLIAQDFVTTPEESSRSRLALVARLSSLFQG